MPLWLKSRDKIGINAFIQEGGGGGGGGLRITQVLRWYDPFTPDFTATHYWGLLHVTLKWRTSDFQKYKYFENWLLWQPKNSETSLKHRLSITVISYKFLRGFKWKVGRWKIRYRSVSRTRLSRHLTVFLTLAKICFQKIFIHVQNFWPNSEKCLEIFLNSEVRDTGKYPSHGCSKFCDNIFSGSNVRAVIMLTLVAKHNVEKTALKTLRKQHENITKRDLKN